MRHDTNALAPAAASFGMMPAGLLHLQLRDVLRLPILADGETSLRRYFSLSDDVGGGDLKYRIRRMIGLKSG